MNAKNDYVFRVEQMFSGGNGAMPGAVLQNYLFVPNTIHVKADSTLTFYDDDTIVAGDGSIFRLHGNGRGVYDEVRPAGHRACSLHAA